MAALFPVFDAATTAAAAAIADPIAADAARLS